MIDLSKSGNCASSETKKASKANGRGQLTRESRSAGFRRDSLPDAPRKRGLQKLINESMLLAITMQQLFQESFVSERRQIIVRAQLKKDGHGYPPGHPLSRIIS